MDVKLSKIQILFFLGIFYTFIPLGALSIKLNFPILPIVLAIWALLLWQLRLKHNLVPALNTRDPLKRYPEINYILNMLKKRPVRLFLLILFAILFLISYLLSNLAFLFIYIKIFE